MPGLIRPLFTALLLLAPAFAAAEPWCLVLDAQENCRWLTAEDCYNASNQVGGYCKPNPRERGITGIAPYCVITADQRRCTYRSQRRCLDVAVAVSGGCVRNTELDLARRARGEERDLGCVPGDLECETDTLGSFSGGLDAAGYSTEQIPVPVLED
ncbi:MAG: hypothetical protein V2J12_08790 [Gammaproteobacteria bacterium]|jgi:hypothetical protein|nr:hypothetical protein [Gammaproteobacteria bacterium]